MMASIPVRLQTPNHLMHPGRLRSNCTVYILLFSGELTSFSVFKHSAVLRLHAVPLSCGLVQLGPPYLTVHQHTIKLAEQAHPTVSLTTKSLAKIFSQQKVIILRSNSTFAVSAAVEGTVRLDFKR